MGENGRRSWGLFVPPPPPPLRHPPDCDNDMLPVTGLVQSQCAPSPSGDWWRKRGAGEYSQDYYRAQHYLLNVILNYDIKDSWHQMTNHKKKG